MQHDQHVVGTKKRRITKEYFESRPPDVWRVPPKVGDYSITLVRKFPGYEGSMAHDVKFVAHFTGDTIKVDIVEHIAVLPTRQMLWLRKMIQKWG